MKGGSSMPVMFDRSGALTPNLLDDEPVADNGGVEARDDARKLQAFDNRKRGHTTSKV